MRITARPCHLITSLRWLLLTFLLPTALDALSFLESARYRHDGLHRRFTCASSFPTRAGLAIKARGGKSDDDASNSILITESDFAGAGSPRLDLEPSEIPALLFTALQNNDFPTVDAGLKSMWEFGGDETRHIFENNRTDFIESAHKTANEFPTSFYGNAFYGKDWEMETELNRVGGDGGWIATQVMKTVSSDGRLRRWQWELRKRRRPPCIDCWFVESIGSSDRKGQFEAE